MTITEDLLRALSPQVLGVLARRVGNFSEAEDAVQEALLAASTAWAADGVPDDPAAWLQRVAFRRFVDAYRSEEARRRRELVVASWSLAPPPTVETADDTLTCMYLCCHPVLSPALAILLTLRAVGGLTTEEIAAAFLVPAPTIGQRISRAKAKLRGEDAPFASPPADELPRRLRSVLHVLYLIFNEGYAAATGDELARSALSDRALALTRLVHAARPDNAEVAGLLALMLLTDARRLARTNAPGDVSPLGEQDRARWDRACITEGLSILTAAMRLGSASTDCKPASPPCTTRRPRPSPLAGPRSPPCTSGWNDSPVIRWSGSTALSRWVWPRLRGPAWTCSTVSTRRCGDTIGCTPPGRTCWNWRAGCRTRRSSIDWLRPARPTPGSATTWCYARPKQP